MSQLYVAILGQSNASGLSNAGDDNVSGIDVIDATLSNANIYDNIIVNNHAVNGSAVDGNHGRADKENWWYFEPESANNFEAAGTVGAGAALVHSMNAIRADLEALSVNTQAGDNIAVIWSQGETEANRINTEFRANGESSVALYKEATINVFEALRAEFGDVTFFMAETGEHNQDLSATGRSESYMTRADAGRDVIQQAQQELAAEYDYIHIAAQLKDYTDHMSDEYHYTDEAYESIGLDIAEDMVNYYQAEQDAPDATADPAQETEAGDAEEATGAETDPVVETEIIYQTLEGTDGNDHIIGTDGHDIIIGHGGEDKLTGGAGADIFTFTSMSDSLKPKDDRITDFVVGEDMIDLSGMGYHAIIDGFGAQQGELRIAYSANSDRTYIRDDNSDFELFLEGDYRGSLDDASFIWGDATPTSQIITGNADANRLTGGSGDDVLNGMAGEDQLTGGNGADIFQFTNMSDSTWALDDRITDFVVGQDMVDLTGLGYDGISTASGAEGLLKLVYSASSDRTYVRDYHDDFQFFLEGNYMDTLTTDSFIL